MDNLYQQMLQRYRTLIHTKAEIADRFRKLDIEKLQIESEMEGAATYLKTGANNPFVRRGLQEIAELKKELSSSTKRTQRVVESKAHIIIRLLQDRAPDGLDIDEIMTALQEQNTEIDRNYLNTILTKLRKKTMAVKNGKKFCITEPGNAPIVAAG